MPRSRRPALTHAAALPREMCVRFSPAGASMRPRTTIIFRSSSRRAPQSLPALSGGDEEERLLWVWLLMCGFELLWSYKSVVDAKRWVYKLYVNFICIGKMYWCFNPGRNLFGFMGRLSILRWKRQTVVYFFNMPKFLIKCIYSNFINICIYIF